MRIHFLLGLSLMLMVIACSGKHPNNSSEQDTAIISENINEDNIDTSIKDTTETEAINAKSSDEEIDYVKTHLVKNGLPTIIDFNAIWCGPCQYMKPIFHKLAKEFKDEYNFVSIDIDEHPELASKYHIQAVPTFVFIDTDGEEGDRIKGAVKEDELRDMLLNPAWF